MTNFITQVKHHMHPIEASHGRGNRTHALIARQFLLRRQTLSAGSNSPPSGLSHIWASPVRYLWHHFFHLWSLVQTLGRGPTFGSPWNSSTPPSLGRGRVVPLSPLPHFSKDSWSCDFNSITNTFIKILLCFLQHEIQVVSIAFRPCSFHSLNDLGIATKTTSL